LKIISNHAESLLSGTKATLFNMTPRIVSPMEQRAVKPQPSTLRNSHNGSVNKSGLGAIASYERVMSDERRYDEIQGPDRNKVRLEQSI